MVHGYRPVDPNTPCSSLVDRTIANCATPGYQIFEFNHKGLQRFGQFLVPGVDPATMAGTGVSPNFAFGYDSNILAATMIGDGKGIPSMTDTSDKVIDSFVQTQWGVLTEGGFWVVLKGKPVVELGMDYGTWRDTQGRRWVDVTFKLDRDADLEHNMTEGFRQLRELIYETVIQAQDDNPELQKEMGSFDPEDPDRWRSDNVWNFNHIGGTNNAGTPKEKALALKMFIDGAEELVKQNLTALMKVLSKPDMMRFHADWDEIILTNVKIDRIVVEYREHKRTGMSADDIKKKYKTEHVGPIPRDNSY